MLLFIFIRCFFTLEFAWLMHSLEKKSNNAAKLLHAMGNMFASRIFLRKLKFASQPSKSSTLTTAANTDKH